MFAVPRRVRWAVPAAALVITGGVMAGSLISVAQAAPALPSRTPAQLLAAVAAGQGPALTGPALTGTVLETASLGLPALPGNNDSTSIASLLTGSHTVKVWYASPEHYRLALPGSLSETDVVRDGRTVWLWQSTADAVTEISVPAHAVAPATLVPSLTPQQAAKLVLAAVGPTTSVSVDSNVMVAGQPAYELVLAPKDARSLVGQVRIAVDGHNAVPLRVQVFARGATSPAISVGFTSVSFAAPAPSDISFTPPPGAKITKVNPDQGGAGPQAATPEVSTIGSGWLTVLDLPSSALNSGTPASGPVSANETAGEGAAALQALLGSAKFVHGTWGFGRLLRTSLVSVLMTTSGTTFVGAVQPSVLYAAASHAAPAHGPVAHPAMAPAAP
jgi:outer membrane lipoprotein-sorting protein